jgi:hypothetical protein
MQSEELFSLSIPYRDASGRPSPFDKASDSVPHEVLQTSSYHQLSGTLNSMFSKDGLLTLSKLYEQDACPFVRVFIVQLLSILLGYTLAHPL